MPYWLTLIAVAIFALTLFGFKLHAVTPKVMLASKSIHNKLQIPLSGYWLSEKYDGVRAIWTGKQFLTRHGYKIQAPKWFTQSLPNRKLDGELWLGRGRFDMTSSIVRTHIPKDSDWKKLKFMVFDLPESLLPFELRQQQLEELISHNGHPQLHFVKQLKVETELQVQTIFSQIINAGGEGVMLRRPNSYYDIGRSNNLIKLKKYDDDDAIVLQHFNGQGQFSEVLGAVLVRNRLGHTFKIGSGFSLNERKNPPAVGSIISYRYTGFTKTGKPRFATFLRQRGDLDKL